MNNEKRGLPKMALYLGYGGLIPFVSLTVASISGIQIEQMFNVSIQQWLAVYGAVILSFLGAIHWGVVIAMADKLTIAQSNNMLIYSIIPSLLAWFSFLFNLQVTLLCLAFLVLVSYTFDHLLLFKQLDLKISREFAKLRLQLSLIVFLSLLIPAFNLS